MHDSSALQAQLADYVARYPEEAALADGFAELGREGGHAYTRERTAGHFTGAAWLVDRSGTRVLLTHHRKLGRWLQLGGHADGDRDLGRVALTEACEESGLPGLVLEPILFDIDRHWIPARGDVAGHWHYDARFVVHAGESEAYVVSEESIDLQWRDIAGLLDDPGADVSLRRMARKWLARGEPSEADASR